MRDSIIGNTLQYPNIKATCTLYIDHDDGMTLMPLTDSNIRAILFWATSNGIDIIDTRKTSIVAKLPIHHIDKLHIIKKTITGISINVVFCL